MRNKIRRLLREICIAGVQNVWLLTTFVTDIVIIVLATVVIIVATVVIIIWKLSHTKGIQVCDGGCLVASGRSAVY